MSIDANSTEHQREVEFNQKETIKLLKAILLGIEIMTGEDNLIERIED